MPLPGGTRLGPYEIAAPLGSGGMGEVYRARDARLGREVALKVLPPEVSGDSARLRRFEKEAQSASALNHPNIVTVYDIGSADSTSYIAMELVDGVTLRQLLAEGALPVKKTLAFGAQIAEGLAKAHEAGIVHRDLKPENVMVTKDGFAKILDFGLAKLTQADDSGGATQAPTVSGGTEPGIVVGTVAYMSPEQALGKPLDFRSDQFSLGSVLYEMATGRKAFARASGPETMTAIIREEPEPIATLAPKAPAPLRWIVERCLAKDQEERYASTSDLSRDLRTIRDRLSEASSSVAAAVAEASDAKRVVRRWLLISAVPALMAAFFLSFRAGQKQAERPLPSFQRVTFRRGEVTGARFAPDGQTIVYSFSRGGLPEDIYSARLGSPEFRAHGLQGAQVLAVSSQGELAAALDWRWGGPEVGYGTLARSSLAGGAPRQLLEQVMDADWDLSGKSLAVLRLVDGGSTRRIEYPLGKTLYESKGLPFLNEPRVSPAADAVAFTELDRPNGVFSVHVMDLAGKRRKLSDGWNQVLGLGWSKDGKEVWFTASRHGEARAFYAVALSGVQRPVARMPVGIRLRDISPDGRVLFTQDSTRREMAGRLFGDSVDRDLSWLDYSDPLDLSADGKRLLFLEAREGSGASPSLWLQTVGEPVPVRLGEGGPGSSLSPDGKWVAAIRTRSNRPNELVLLPTGAGEERRVDLGPVNPYLTHWAGQRLLVEGGAPATLRLYVVPLSGGALRPVAPEGGDFLTVSPDGRALLSGEDSLALYPLEGGEPQTLPVPATQAKVVRNFGANDTAFAWADDDHSVFAGRAGQPGHIYRLNLRTFEATPWRDVGPSDTAGVRSVQPMLITPDGKSYVYTFRRVLSDLYVAEGFK